MQVRRITAISTVLLIYGGLWSAQERGE